MILTNFFQIQASKSSVKLHGRENILAQLFRIKEHELAEMGLISHRDIL
jgi:hypothetical protein